MVSSEYEFNGIFLPTKQYPVPQAFPDFPEIIIEVLKPYTNR